jgi:oligosaccharide repeat unit polymerase
LDGVATYEALLIASVILLICVSAIYLKSDRGSVYHPATIYIAFHAVVFVIRPILAHLSDYNFLYKVYEFAPSMSDKIVTLIVANLGFVVFISVALFLGSAKPRFVKHSDAELRSYHTPLIVTSLLLGPIGIWSLYYSMEVGAGNIEFTMRSDEVTHTVINTTGNGYLWDFQMVLPTLVGMIAYLNRFKWWSLLPFVVYVVARGATGLRGPFIAAIFFMVLLYLYHRRRRWLTASTALLCAGGWALFRLVGDDRGQAIRDILGYGPGDRVALQWRTLESMDYGNMEFLEFLVHCIPKRTGSYDYFASLSQILTEPIPRVWWPNKPVGAPIQFFNLFDCGNPVGMTFSLPGVGWFEFGWIGVVVWCAFFAWIYAKLYNKFQTSTHFVFAVLLYFSFAITALVSFRDGIVLSILKQSLFYMMPVVILGISAYVFGARPHGLRPWGMDQHTDRQVSPRERRRKRATELDAATPRLRRQQAIRAGVSPAADIKDA